MSIAQLVRGVLPVEPDRETEQTTEESPRSTRLYRCDTCSATYISEEMDSCPRCDTAVESVPTERDLGLV